jgi:hypothetical protein
MYAFETNITTDDMDFDTVVEFTLELLEKYIKVPKNSKGELVAKNIEVDLDMETDSYSIRFTTTADVNLENNTYTVAWENGK